MVVLMISRRDCGHLPVWRLDNQRQPRERIPDAQLHLFSLPFSLHFLPSLPLFYPIYYRYCSIHGLESAACISEAGLLKLIGRNRQKHGVRTPAIVVVKARLEEVEQLEVEYAGPVEALHARRPVDPSRAICRKDRPRVVWLQTRGSWV
ncbi:hypothetical protein FKM82_008629 [Ascaphus truei]